MKRIILAIVVLTIAYIALLSHRVSGQVPNKVPNSYVHDYSGVLSNDDIASLNASIFEIEKKTSVQIAIVLVKTVPDKFGDISDFSREIGRTWHVGNAKNGLVYVAAIDQHKQRLEVAQNLEGDIPDVEALHITDDLKVYFRQQDYAGGLKQLVKEINNHVDPIAKEQLRLAKIEQDKKDKETLGAIGTVFLWIAFIGLTSWLLWFLFWGLPAKRKRKREDAEASLSYSKTQKSMRDSLYGNTLLDKKRREYNTNDERVYTPPPYIPDDTPTSNSSYESPKSDDNDYGNYGSGSSSDTNDSGSGFSGGGASNDW